MPLLKGLLIGVAISLPFETAVHFAYEYAQHKSREEFGKDLGDEICLSLYDKLAEKLQAEKGDISLQDKKNLEKIATKSTAEIMDRLYWEVTKEVGEDVIFHDVLRIQEKEFLLIKLKKLLMKKLPN